MINYLITLIKTQMTNSKKRMQRLEELYQSILDNLAVLDAKLEERLVERQALEAATVRVEPDKK